MRAAKSSAAVGTDCVGAILTGVGFTRNHCTSALPESGWTEVLWLPLKGHPGDNFWGDIVCAEHAQF